MNYKVGVISGDGIGPEIVREAKKILDKVGTVFGHTFSYDEILMGGVSIDAVGVPLTDDAVAQAKAADAVLMGSMRGKYHYFPLVQASTRFKTGGRTVKVAQGSEFVCKSQTRIFV